MANLPEILRGRESRPFREISRLQRQIERLFEDFFTPGSFGEYHLPTGFAPSAEVEESEKEYLLTFDIPGLKKDDIKIELSGNQLRISGERKEETEKKKHGFYQSERFYGSFERSFSVPPNVKVSDIRADYEDGVLKIAIPKTEAMKSQQIKIGEKKEKGEKAA